MTHIRILRACKAIENRRIGKEKLLWILFAGFIAIISSYDNVIERYYSNGVYPYIGKLLRFITGFAPFSIGDLLYIILLIYLLVKGIYSLRKRVKQPFKSWIIDVLVGLFLLVIKIYVLFMVCWGLNYSRSGIEKRLNLVPIQYDTTNITLITNELIDSVNRFRKLVSVTSLPQYSKAVIIEKAIASYTLAEKQNPFLSYQYPAIKKTFFTPFSNHLGFLGYYNPFSGEAQVRMDIPNVLIPFITCHEIAHQLGNASEDQANFMGYLACKSSPDPYFKYSVYLELLNYALAEQYRLYGANADFKSFEHIIKSNRNRMDTLVKLDRKLIRQFFDKRRNNVAPVVSTLYDQYLRMNKQNAGIGSYDLVVKWLIAYKATYGKI